MAFTGFIIYLLVTQPRWTGKRITRRRLTPKGPDPALNYLHYSQVDPRAMWVCEAGQYENRAERQEDIKKPDFHKPGFLEQYGRINILKCCRNGI